MSSSCRNRSPLRCHSLQLMVGAMCTANVMLAAPTLAAQFYVQPAATLTAENDSNLDLDPGSNTNVQGYLAAAGALFGIATPNWETTARARLEYRDYPKDSADNRLEEYLDFRSDYSTPLSHAAISGTIDHRDEFNAAFSSAYFNEINPVQPTNPTTGRAVTGETQTMVLVQPSYSYKFSPLIDVGVSAIYQKVSYSPAIFELSNFDYYQGSAELGWKYSQKSELSFSGFGSKYNSTQISSTATGGGATVGLDTNWTPLLSTQASVSYQHTNVDQSAPPVVKTGVNTLGGSAAVVYKAQLDQYRVIVSRFVTPSGGGGVYVNDQAQFQYTRELTERLAFTGAMIWLKSSQLPNDTNGLDRTYDQTAIDVKWMVRPTWFVQGGYQYTWQKYVQSPEASNNRIFIRVGYQGLPPQR
jgi:hypothetical protein